MMGIDAPATLSLGAGDIRLEHVGASASSRIELDGAGPDPGLRIHSTKHISFQVGETTVRIDANGISVDTAPGKRLELAVAGGTESRLTMSDRIEAVARSSVALEQGAHTKLVLEDSATLDAPVTAIRGAGQLSVASDGPCTVEGAAVTITSEMTCVEGTQTRITDGTGGVIALAGGIIRLN